MPDSDRAWPVPGSAPAAPRQAGLRAGARAPARQQSRSPSVDEDACYRLPSNRITPQRLAHAVHAATALRDHVDLRVVDLQAKGSQTLLQKVTAVGQQHTVVANRDDLAAEHHRALERRRDDLDALALQPVDAAWIDRFETNRSEFGRRHHDHQIDVNVIRVDAAQAHFPALLLEPSFELQRALLLRAALDALPADQHAVWFDDVEVAAFERAGGDVVVDRDTEPLIRLNRAEVLPA